MNKSKPDDRTCPVCGEESDLKYRCSECGKLFEEDKHASGRSVLGGSK